MDMDDKMLDKLIVDALQRRETLEVVNKDILREVRHRARLEWMKKWGRVVAFSFGLPLLLLVFAFGIYAAASSPSLGHFRYFLLIPLLTMLYLVWREMKNFSIAEV